jgi:hypothetical protein
MCLEYTTSGFDLGCKAGIRRARASDITFTLKHVYGHQDNNPWNTLDLLSTLNQYADKKAGELRRELEMSWYHPRPRCIHGEGWIPLIHGERIVRKTKYNLRLSTTWPRLLTHWSKKHTEMMDLKCTQIKIITLSLF